MATGSAPRSRALAGDVPPVFAEYVAGAPRRVIALVKQASDDGRPSMLTMRETERNDDGTGRLVELIEEDGTTTRWRTIATRFEDRTRFFRVVGRTEVWRFVSPPPRRRS